MKRDPSVLCPPASLLHHIGEFRLPQVPLHHGRKRTRTALLFPPFSTTFRPTPPVPSCVWCVAVDTSPPLVAPYRDAATVCRRRYELTETSRLRHASIDETTLPTRLATAILCVVSLELRYQFPSRHHHRWTIASLAAAARRPNLSPRAFHPGPSLTEV